MISKDGELLRKIGYVTEEGDYKSDKEDDDKEDEE